MQKHTHTHTQREREMTYKNLLLFGLYRLSSQGTLGVLLHKALHGSCKDKKAKINKKLRLRFHKRSSHEKKHVQAHIESKSLFVKFCHNY